MSDLYDRLRRIRERKENKREPGPDRIPGPDWNREAPGVYRRARSMAVPPRYLDQIHAGGQWGPISGVIRHAGGAGATARPLFIDVETSGLSAGSGSVAFLVGLGEIHESSATIRVEQLFLGDLGAEGAFTEILHRMIEESGADSYVTYNGASFDLPVLRTRSILARKRFPERVHFDLLPVTRRLYAPVIGSCRLAAVEQKILRSHRDNDVPGSEVPGLYLAFLRTGDPRELASVTDHHFYDIAHLAYLAFHLNDVLSLDPAEGGPAELDPAALDPAPEPDLVELLRVILERGDPAERIRAEATLERHVRNGRSRVSSRWERLADLYAIHRRRQRKWAELIETLRMLHERRGALDDAVNLAIQLEHRRKDYSEALRIVTGAGDRWGWSEDLKHRAARLRRRISRRDYRVYSDTDLHIPGPTDSS